MHTFKIEHKAGTRRTAVMAAVAAIAALAFGATAATAAAAAADSADPPFDRATNPDAQSACIPNPAAMFTTDFSIQEPAGTATVTIAVQGDAPLCEPESVTLVSYLASGATRETALPQVLSASVTKTFTASATLTVKLPVCAPYQVDFIWGDQPLPRIDNLWENGGPDYAPSDLVSLSSRAIDLNGPSYVIGARPQSSCEVAPVVITPTTVPPAVTPTTVAKQPEVAPIVVERQPTTTTTVAAPTTAPKSPEVAGLIITAPPVETLPVTGAEPTPFVAAAVLFIFAGAGLVAVARHKNHA
ncbi:MAG: LPXTG cell wall anchor domain-containing protein [Acidimicrobiia bacterium]